MTTQSTIIIKAWTQKFTVIDCGPVSITRYYIKYCNDLFKVYSTRKMCMYFNISFHCVLLRVYRSAPVIVLLPDTWNCGLRMRRECRERFPRHCGLTIMTCIASGFLWRWQRRKRSRHSRRMRNAQLYVSGKRPMATRLQLEFGDNIKNNTWNNTSELP